MNAFVGRTLSVATLLMVLAVCALAQDYTGRDELRSQSNEFRKDVIQVTDGVFVAVGYSASNVILIQGEGGSIVVDTSTDLVAARQIIEAFGSRFRTPVRAVIYTHSHPDHTGGLPLSQLNQALTDLNNAYVPTGITFHRLAAIDYIDSDAFYFNIDTAAVFE